MTSTQTSFITRSSILCKICPLRSCILLYSTLSIPAIFLIEVEHKGRRIQKVTHKSHKIMTLFFVLFLSIQGAWSFEIQIKKDLQKTYRTHGMICIISKSLKILFVFIEMTYQFTLAFQSLEQRNKNNHLL